MSAKTRVARPYHTEMSLRALSDEQIRNFLANGYLLLQPQLPADYHTDIFQRLTRISSESGLVGNNLLPRVPELTRLFSDPVIAGALTSLLGAQYLMHPHRALHDNAPGSEPQAFHKDSYWGHTRRVRNHHPWWVMVMYFPQDTPVAKGPTGVLRGTPYLNQKLNVEEVPAAGPAGTCLLIHYDIWHRKMRNHSSDERFMLKFEFTRLLPPRADEWRGRATQWRQPRLRPEVDLNPVWRESWRWLAVGSAPEPRSVRGIQKSMETLETAPSLEGDEAALIHAAYSLAQAPDGVPRLLRALSSCELESDNVKRYSEDGSRWHLGSTGAYSGTWLGGLWPTCGAWPVAGSGCGQCVCT